MTIICPCCGEEISDEFRHCPECRFDIEQYNKEPSADVKASMLARGKEAYVKEREVKEIQKEEWERKAADQALHPERVCKRFCRIGLLLLVVFFVVGMSGVLKQDVLPVVFAVGMVGCFLWIHGVTTLSKLVNRVSTLKRVGVDQKCPKCGTFVETWDKETWIHVWFYKLVAEGGRTVACVVFAIALLWLLDILTDLPLGLSWLSRILLLVAPATLIWVAFFSKDRLQFGDTCPKCGNKKLVTLTQADIDEENKNG